MVTLLRYARFSAKSLVTSLTDEQEIIKTAFENGINMFDEAENYADGQSEIEM